MLAQLPVPAARHGAFADGPSQGIAGEGLRAVTVEVARELIEQQHGGARGGRITKEFTSGALSERSQLDTKAPPQRRIKRIIAREPLPLRHMVEPEMQQFSRPAARGTHHCS